MSAKKTDISVEAKTEENYDPEGHDFHKVLTNAQFRAAQKVALEEIEAERRKDATKAVVKAEKERLAREQGLVVGGEGQEPETIVINLVDPDINSCLMVNGEPFWHGQAYTRPRHFCDSLREMMNRLERYTAREIRGEKLSEYYMRSRATQLSGVTGATNAPRPVGGRVAA
jgi:hypothetical protein